MERDRPKGTATDEVVSPGPDADALSLAQVEAVLRRAVQIDAQARAPGATGLSSEELTRVALEAGLSPSAVDAALRELKLGELDPQAQQGFLDRRIGPSVARAGRVVELPPEAAAARLAHALGEELFEPLERQGRRVTWCAQEGLRANVLRTVRRGWGGARDWRRVEIVSDVRAADASGQRSVAALEARLQGRGKSAVGSFAFASVAAVATFGLAGLGFSHLAQHVPDALQLLLGSGAMAVAGAGGSALALSSGAKAWQNKVRRARAALDKILGEL